MARRRWWFYGACVATLLVIGAFLLLRATRVIVTTRPIPGRAHSAIQSVSFVLWPGSDSNTYDNTMHRFRVVARYPVEVRKGVCSASAITDREFDCSGTEPLQIKDSRRGTLGFWNRVVVSYEIETP